jgi:hypothetical protein
MKNLSIVKNKDFNQELSIAARKEFAKGNINIAWAMELKANTLVEGTTKEQWIAFNIKKTGEKKWLNTN